VTVMYTDKGKNLEKLKSEMSCTKSGPRTTNESGNMRKHLYCHSCIEGANPAVIGACPP
jgi:hypothetical protein